MRVDKPLPCFCYTAIGAVPADGRFTRKMGASIGKSEARPLWEMHIPPVLSTIAMRRAFTVPPETTSYFPKLHKSLVKAFFLQETIGE